MKETLPSPFSERPRQEWGFPSRKGSGQGPRKVALKRAERRRASISGPIRGETRTRRRHTSRARTDGNRVGCLLHAAPLPRWGSCMSFDRIARRAASLAQVARIAPLVLAFAVG